MSVFKISVFMALISNIALADFSKDNLVIAVGAKAESVLTKRGLITYGSKQIIPIFAIDLINPNLQFIGSSLFYKYNFSENLNLRLRYNFNASNDTPLYETSENEDKRIEREKTQEIDTMLEYESNSIYSRIIYSKDIVEHNGAFIDTHIRYALFENKIGKKNLNLKTNIFFEAGYGDHKHNEYLYGNDESGVTYQSYGINLSTPEVIDSFWPVIQIEHFELLNSAIDGIYVDEKSGYKFSALMAFKIW